MELLPNNSNAPKPIEALNAPPESPAASRRGSAYDLSSPQTPGNISSPIRTFQERQHVAKQSLAMDVLLPPNMHALPRSEVGFPVKLHQLLSSSDGRIIRWQPKNDGKSFTILNCDAFEAEMLPRLYRTANIEVFGQLLSLYGFQRVDNGPYEGDYYHTMFVRDKPQLAHMIRKGGETGHGATPTAHPTAHPTGYAPVPSTMVGMSMNHSIVNSMHASVTSRLAGLNFPGKLHYLLCHGIYDLGLEGIMRWQPGGHAFAVYSSEEFEMQGLAEMLGTPGHASFRAQLSLHGFQRVRSDGPDVEAYYHADFVREQPHLCRMIRSRNHLKSNVIRRTTPGTPTRHRTLVSPLSNTSIKSTISSVPDGLFVDPRSSFLLTPESQKIVKAAAPPMHAAALPLTTVKQDSKKDGSKPRKRPRVGHMMPQNYFPFKLHSLLTLAEKYGLQNILCWAPHGRCFLVNDKDLFCATVLPLFRHSEFASFRAQLKAYGFVRIGRSGPDKGAYFHMSFLRGSPEHCATITRRPKNVNGTVRGRPKGRCYVEPDFYKMKFLPDLDIEQIVPPPGNIKDILEAALTQITPPAVVTREVSTSAGAVSGANKAKMGQAISITRDTSEVVATLVRQNDTSDTTLPVKLHALLNDAHDHSFNRIVGWNDSGRSFAISDEKVFDEILCEKWLDIPSLTHFQAELEGYGFKRRQNGLLEGSYYHEMFHKALPHLCRCIKKEETAKISASDSSMETNPVIVIDKPSSPVAEVSHLDASSSTLSAGYTVQRTPSPELEVAIALTAMDDRSSGGEPKASEAVDDAKPLPIGDDKPAPAAGSDETEQGAKAVSSPAIRPSSPAVNKRRSLDPPASCGMLNTQEDATAANEAIKKESKEEENGKSGREGTAKNVERVDMVDSQGSQMGTKFETQKPKAEKTMKTEVLNMEIDLTCNSETEDHSTLSDQPSHTSQPVPSIPAPNQDSMTTEEANLESMIKEEELSKEASPDDENLPVEVCV